MVPSTGLGPTSINKCDQQVIQILLVSTVRAVNYPTITLSIYLNDLGWMFNCSERSLIVLNYVKRNATINIDGSPHVPAQNEKGATWNKMAPKRLTNKNTGNAHPKSTPGRSHQEGAQGASLAYRCRLFFPQIFENDIPNKGNDAQSNYKGTTDVPTS